MLFLHVHLRLGGLFSRLHLTLLFVVQDGVKEQGFWKQRLASKSLLSLINSWVLCESLILAEVQISQLQVDLLLPALGLV
jgi:hypothetical protein